MHSPAFSAKNVRVPVRPPIKAVAARRFDRADDPRFFKKVEIAVHGAAADLLVLLAYVQIDIVRCWMIIVRTNGVEHKRALARVASLHTHGDPFRCIYTAPVA